MTYSKIVTPLTDALVPLTNLLEKDAPRVLVLVGAGISIGATSAPHASWLGLLKHGVRHLVDTQILTERRGQELGASLDAAFSPFDLDTALRLADLVAENLAIPDTAAFAAWLHIAFHDLRIQSGKRDSLDALRDLQDAGALLVTTNYDHLLSEATGLPPVAWDEHDRLFQVVRGHQPGILHIHGHWQRPDSVVLGRTAYDRIVQDRDFQDVFKSLWLERSWLYVGCGDGIGDPNLGRLLEWGKRWNKDRSPDYLLVQGDKSLGRTDQPDEPANVVSVSYPDYADLPAVLHSILPAARCSPFIPLNEDFALFRSAGSPVSDPFPSRQEYVDGKVPVFASDTEVAIRLDQHGWAFVLDVASVGKTTLALRIATAPAQRNNPVFYLDLATPDVDEVEATAATRRLSRPSSLLIVDNAHHRPELARQLWERWRSRPRQSRGRLLLIATRTQRTVTTAPTQDLGFFEYHSVNPTIALNPAPKDLGAILKHLYGRFAGRHAKPVPTPSLHVLEGWHREYGSALGAFSLAALARLAKFKHGEWDLPPEAASDWVREMWFKHLDAENRENLLCLAVFGAQEFELQVLNESLPHPDRTAQLLSLGLVAKTLRGQFGQYHKFSLRQPGWGRLILAAETPPVDEKQILFEAAARHPATALPLSARLRRNNSHDLLAQLWAHLNKTPQNLIKLVYDQPLKNAAVLAHAAKTEQQPILENQLWEAIERDPTEFAEHVWEAPLGDVAFFFAVANRDQRNMAPLWEAIEREPTKIAEQAWETPLGYVASFVDTAKRQQRNTVPLWEAIERDPAKFAERAWEMPLGDVASFLDTAKRHRRNTVPLWQALERDPARFAEQARQTPLNYIASFLETAKRHQRNTVPLWEALERDPAQLAEQVKEAPLGQIASFLETAKRHQRNTRALWEAIDFDPTTFAERAWESSLGGVASFLETARRQQRSTVPLWEAIELDLTRVAELAWETPLSDVASFLDFGKRHRRDAVSLWEAIEANPVKLVERLWETSLGQIASFLDTAHRHQRDTSLLWQAIESEPDRIAERAWEISLEHVAFFLDTAQRHHRNADSLWEAIEREPDRIAERAWETSLEHVAFFLDIARRHHRNTDPLWEAIEREPDRIAARVWETPLEHIAHFQGIANDHGRDTGPLWRILESKPEQLSLLAKNASVPQLVGFCRRAPTPVTAIALSALQPTDWDGIPASEPLLGATWLAFRCAEAGREDLKLALITAMLRRANPHDFPSLQSSSLANVAWLLQNAPSGVTSLIPAFLDAVCTKTWLERLFTNAPCGALAKGLRILGLHQSAEVYRRFESPKLSTRLQKELSRFDRLDSQEQSMVIQLLGCATLCGWSASAAWFGNVSLATTGLLPIEALPHRSEADHVESWQFQLWLGLRAVTSATMKAIAMPRQVIIKTLDLWRFNVAQSSIERSSKAHQVNEAMVAWLESCVDGNEGLLPPSGL